MRTVLLLTIACLSVSLAGCQGSAFEVAGRDDFAMQASKDHEILDAYAFSRQHWGENKRLRAELERRGFFTAAEWDKVDRRTFALGDAERVVWAAWGKPDDVSTLRTGSGVSRLLVYGNRAENRVYITDGRVSAIGQ